MTEEDRGFVRGFAVAVAAMLRHQVNAEDLLRSIGATETLLRSAGVDEYDLNQLRATLRTIER